MSSLALVSWISCGYQFALEARRVQSLQPWSATLESHGLHSFIPGLEAETPAYCLGWQLDGEHYLLALGNEPRHLDLPLEALWPLPAAMQSARQSQAIQALGWLRQQPLIILDMRGLSRQIRHDQLAYPFGRHTV